MNRGDHPGPHEILALLGVGGTRETGRSKPSLDTLPHDELLAKLRSLTNLRAVRDPASDTAWKIDIGPFPGWANVPEWQP